MLLVPFIPFFSRTVSSGTPCPDLVGQPGLIERYKKSHPKLSSSLPDVSSIGYSSEVGMLEDSTHKSTESLVLQPGKRQTEDIDISDCSDDLDLEDLDSELDAHVEIDHSVGSQRFPDCVVESVMNEDHRCDEMPVAFSESIGQRVRRERPSRRPDFDQKEPADVVKDANQSENEAKEKEEREEGGTGQAEVVRGETDTRMPEMLDFVGDWPSQVSVEQRQMRRRERHREESGEEGDGLSKEIKNIPETGPAVTEFQKLVDLIQCYSGVAAIQASPSPLSSPSQSCGEELQEEEEAGDTSEESHGSRSNSEERGQNMSSVKSSRSHLPDCVLDWKTADNCEVRKSKTDDHKELQTQNETCNSTGGNDQMIFREAQALDLTQPTSSINPLSNLSAEVGTEPGGSGHIDRSNNRYTGDGRETGTEADGTSIDDACQSPLCEGSGEADQGSHERKQRHGRRSGKQCKLALTFTQNCPVSSLNTLEYPETTAHNIDSCQVTEVEPNLNPTSNSSLNTKPGFDPFTKSTSQADIQPPCPCPLIDTGCFTQTEPQDFSLLWRLNHQDSPDDTLVTACNHCSDFVVMSGDPTRFVPEMSAAVSAAVAVHPSGHKEVPYRVVHEKGTQVEEKELGAAQDRFESLRILSRHFKLVSFDTLEDLYDKCHQDLEWTTNLLLDSGEKFFRDEDGAQNEEDQNTFSLCGALGEIVQTNMRANILVEDLQKTEPAEFVKGTQQPTCGTGSESNESSSDADIPCFESVAASASNGDCLDTNSQLERAPQTELSRPEATKERKVISVPSLGGGIWGGSLEDGVIIEESTIEMEYDTASMDEVHRLLQAELEEMEREEKRKKEEKTERRQVEERRSKHLDIQSLELKLPTELALQLTELFGPVGVDPGNENTGVTFSHTYTI